MYAKVYVEITNICNMHCSFCHGHQRPPRRMTQEEFAAILAQLKGKTEHLYYHLMGEPLTHPSLPDFLDMAAEQGFRSIITTNGTRLAEVGERLPAHGVHKVSISLHRFEAGSDEAYSRYLQECCDFADLASQRGTIVVFRLWNRGCDGGRNEIAYNFLRKRLSGEWVPNTRGIRIRHKLHLEWGDRFAWPDLSAPLQGKEVYCYGLQDHFAILCDGTVVPCCMDSEGTLALGNILTQRLDEILSSPRATQIREGFARHVASEELCRRCAYAQRFV